MTVLLLSSLAASLLAAATAILVFPLVKRIAMAARAMDYPGGRRVQREAVPRMGGITIGAGIVAGAGGPAVLVWQTSRPDVTLHDATALILGTGLVFMVGLAEDLIGVRASHRIAVQLAAAVAVVSAGWSFGRLYVPMWGNVELGIWGGLMTIVWIVGVTNAINLMDGLDGLAGGVAAIIATSLLMFALIQGHFLTIILMSATVGACLGFLRHNWAPAEIYMGDSGSLTLGFLLAVMSMHSSIKGATAVAILVPILALGLPVIDTLLVMAVRFGEKPKGPLMRRFARMFKADRNHLHHVMARSAPERRQIVLIIYFVAVCFCAMALVVAISRSAVLGTILVVVEISVVLIMRNLGVRREARSLSREQHRHVREVFLKRA